MFDWIKSYLTDRLQHVNIGDSYSDAASMKLGVPQVSIRDPLLFLNYLNFFMSKSPEGLYKTPSTLNF